MECSHSGSLEKPRRTSTQSLQNHLLGMSVREPNLFIYFGNTMVFHFNIKSLWVTRGDNQGTQPSEAHYPRDPGCWAVYPRAVDL